MTRAAAVYRSRLFSLSGFGWFASIPIVSPRDPAPVRQPRSAVVVCGPPWAIASNILRRTESANSLKIISAFHARAGGTSIAVCFPGDMPRIMLKTAAPRQAPIIPFADLLTLREPLYIVPKNRPNLENARKMRCLFGTHPKCTQIRSVIVPSSKNCTHFHSVIVRKSFDTRIYIP